MRVPHLVTFLSDFGLGGGYVAACEAVMLRIHPATRVLHITHEVPVGDVSAGALVLSRVLPLGAPAVHLAVVDPGVGTARHALALVAARGDILVGPDNGLLVEAADCLGGLREAWGLDHHRVRALAGAPAGSFSATFHGRDVFAPAAALFARGKSPADVASALDPASLVRLGPRRIDWVSTREVAVEVIEVDRFGNVALALSFEDLKGRLGVPAQPVPSDSSLGFTVDLPGEGLPSWKARLVHTYGDLRPGELGVFRDSWGQVALALNGASAAELLGVRLGTLVRLKVTEEPAQ